MSPPMCGAFMCVRPFCLLDGILREIAKVGARTYWVLHRLEQDENNHHDRNTQHLRLRSHNPARYEATIVRILDGSRVAKRTAPGTPHRTDHSVSDASTVTSCMSNFSPNRTGSTTFPTIPCTQPGRKKARKPRSLPMQPLVRYVEMVNTVTRMRHQEWRN